MQRGNLHKFDFIILSSLIVFSRVMSVFLHASFFISTILFFGLPALYLTIRIKDTKAIKKAGLFALLSMIPIAALDVFAVTNKSWLVPSSIFSFRIFDIVPLEDLIWGGLLIYTTVLFYEYFLDRGKNMLKINKLARMVVIFFVTLLFFGVIFLYLNPEFLKIPYYYFWGGIIFILVPTIAFLIFYPKLIHKFLIAGLYFFFLGLVFEITGLELRQWEFPTMGLLGWVDVFNYRFPAEELLFWLILFSSATLSYYEFLFDDRK